MKPEMKLTAVTVYSNGHTTVAFIKLPVTKYRTAYGQERERVVCPSNVYDRLASRVGARHGATVTIG